MNVQNIMTLNMFFLVFWYPFWDSKKSNGMIFCMVYLMFWHLAIQRSCTASHGSQFTGLEYLEACLSEGLFESWHWAAVLKKRWQPLMQGSYASSSCPIAYIKLLQFQLSTLSARCTNREVYVRRFGSRENKHGSGALQSEGIRLAFGWDPRLPFDLQLRKSSRLHWPCDWVAAHWWLHWV